MNYIVLSKPDEYGVGRIGYRNLFETGTVTASHDTLGFEKENAYDGFGYDWWKGGSTTAWSYLTVQNSAAEYADYFAVYGHNLNDIDGEVLVQYSTDGITWTDIVSTQFYPINNNVFFVEFDQVFASYYRVNFRSATSSGSPLVAGILLGESLKLPRDQESGFEPPSLVPMITNKTAQSESGAFIGGSRLSVGIEGDIRMRMVKPEWVRSEWIPFIEHVQTPKPFVFAWDVSGHSTEVILGWTKGQVRSPSYSSVTFMDVSLSFEGKL